MGDVGNGIQIPVPAEKERSFFRAEGTKKAIDGFAKGQIVNAALHIIRRRDALLQLCAERTDYGTAFQTAAPAAAIQRNVAGDPGQKCIQIAYQASM